MIGARSKPHPKGLTLIEIVGALGIFLVVMTSMLGIFGFLIRIQREQLALQSSLDNFRTNLEIMARAIRQADPNSLTGCPTLPGDCLQFHHNSVEKNTPNDDGTMMYSLDVPTGEILETSGSTEGDASPITSSDIFVDSLRFSIQGLADDDEQQPLVTITLGVHSVRDPGKIFTVQTAVGVRSFQE